MNKKEIIFVLLNRFADWEAAHSQLLLKLFVIDCLPVD